MNYQAEIDRLRDLQDAARAEVRKRKVAEWQELTAKPENWIWKATPGTVEPDRLWTKYGGRPCVYLTKHLRPTVLQAWKEGGTDTLSFAFSDGYPQGIRFVLTDEGILTHEGGGTVILDTPRLCSPQEWEAICNAEPPAKFIR